MTYPNDPETPTGRKLAERFEREAVKILLIGTSSAVQQCVLELEKVSAIATHGVKNSQFLKPTLLFPLIEEK